MTKEIEALLKLKGHEEEARAEPLEKSVPKYARVCTLSLHSEQRSLEGPARRIVLKREYDERLRESMMRFHWNSMRMNLILSSLKTSWKR